MPKQAIQYKTGGGERFFYGFYFVGQLMFYILVTSFLQLYMTDIGIPATVVGIIFLITKVWDAVNDPLFGVIVDKSNRKSGKYIPWVRLSTFLIPVATIFLFAAPLNASVQIKAIWVTVGYMLWDTSYTVCDVPIFALATSMTDDLAERDRLYILNRFFMLVGGVIAVVAVPMLYPQIGWTLTAVIISVLAMLTMLPIGYKAKERYFSAETEKNPSVRNLIRYLFSNKPLLIFNAAVVITALTNTSSAVQSYCAIYCLGDVEWISILGIIVMLPMLISVIVVQQVIKKIDKRTVFIVCHAVNLLLGVVMYFAGYENKVIFILITVVRAAFAAAGTILIVMFTADCAEYGNYKTGERAQGVAFSIQTFSAKITGALSSAIGMFVLGLVGFVEGANAPQTPETIAWIWRMYSIFPIISGSLSLLLLIFGYKLYSADVKLMMQVNAGEITREQAETSFSRPY